MGACSADCTRKGAGVVRAVMPDHLHLCFTIKGRLPNAVTTLIGRWLSALEEEAHRCGVLPQDEWLWEDKSVVDAGDYAETF